MSLPKSFNFELPLTAIIMSQAVINASSVHLSLKLSHRISFCCFGSLLIDIFAATPGGTISWCLSSWTTVSASISTMNRFLKVSRTFSAAGKTEWYMHISSTSATSYTHQTCHIIAHSPLWAGPLTWWLSRLLPGQASPIQLYELPLSYS